MANLSKLLFIGIDAGDKDLIMNWAGAGLLPNLARLFKQSAWAVTSSPVGLYVGAIWPSFYTAVSPGTHGRYCYQQLQPGSYDVRRVSPREVQAEPFWNSLSDHGKRVAVIDVPKTFPAELRNGLHIVDWGSHDPDPAGFSAWPESVVTEIQQHFGGKNMHSCNAFRTTREEFSDFRESLIQRIETKTRLDLHFLEQGNWDCFMTVFSESHCVGHQCWHLHDKNHQKYDPGLLDEAGDPLLTVYQAIDSGIGKLIDRAGEQTDVAVFASHGIGPHYDATYMLDDMLKSLEGEKQGRVKLSLAKRIAPLWKKMPQPLRSLAQPLSKRARIGLGVEKRALSPAEQARRRYFSIPNNDAWGGVRINLAGREPCGTVAPGAEYEAVCKGLCEDLRTFVNVESGEPLIKRILLSRDEYEGKNVQLLPDLLLEWHRSAPVSIVSSPKTGRIHGEYKKCRTGDHRPDGLIMFQGPSIRPGRIEQPVSVMDIAPTLASLAGVELRGVEGKPIRSIFSAG